MKNWIISGTDFYDKYLIATEKAIWLTDQNKNSDIQELITNSSLGSVTSIRYENLKEIIFNDTDFSIEFNFKDDNIPEEEFSINQSVYSDIKNYFKNHLRGTEIKDYSIFKQLLPQLIILGISVILIVATYISAMELQKGENIKVAGRKAWIKEIIVSIAEVLGTIGTIVVGVLVISALVYFIIKKYQNPKRGEILKIKKTPRLTI